MDDAVRYALSDLRSKAWLLLITVAIGAGLGGLYASSGTTPVFEATARVVVLPDVDDPGDIEDSLVELRRANLFNQYVALALDPSTLDKVVALYDLPPEVRDYSLEVERVGNTLVVAFVAGGPDDGVAAVLADGVARYTSAKFAWDTPPFMPRFVDSAAVTVEEASFPPSLYTAAGAAAGFLVGVVLILLGVRGMGPDRESQSTSATDGEGSERPPLVPSSSLARALLAIVGGAAVALLASGDVTTMMVVGALAAAAGFLALIATPGIALIGLVALVSLRLSDIAHDFHRFPEITVPVVGIVGLALILRWVLWGEAPRGWLWGALILAAIAAAGTISALTATSPAASFEEMVDLAKNGLIALLILILINNARDFRIAVWTLVFSGTALAALSVFQFTTSTFDNNYFGFAQARVQNIALGLDDFRVSGPISDPNFYGQMLVAVFPLAMERAWNERVRLLRLLAIAGSIVIPLAVVFTFSRGALVGLGVVLIVMLFVLRPSPRAIAISLVIGVALISLVPQAYLERAGTLLEVVNLTQPRALQDEAFEGRSSEVMAALHMFQDYPFTGVGLGNYPIRYNEYSSFIGIDDRGEAREAHSLYAEIAAETGIVGLIAWFGGGLAIFRIFTRAGRRLRLIGAWDEYFLIRGFGAGLIGFFFAAVFLHLAFARFMWMLVAIALAIPKVVESVEIGQRAEGLPGSFVASEPLA